MSMEPKPITPAVKAAAAAASRRDKGIRIFSYPKIIFLFPTLVAAIICWLGMLMNGDNTTDPTRPVSITQADGTRTTAPGPAAAKHERFTTPQNLFAILFLGVLAFNLMIMAIDFPRFTIVAMILGVLFAVFFLLWLGAAFDFELLAWFRRLMGSIYATANAEFYLLTSLILSFIFGVVYVTRYLDYWEILPNEILHHHGPLSDLERLPTTNLKFDKEIPDVLEHMFLGAGRLVLHVSNERKSIVMDNVLFINTIENALKTQMSRMEVRLTTDQEVADVT